MSLFCIGGLDANRLTSLASFDVSRKLNNQRQIESLAADNNCDADATAVDPPVRSAGLNDIHDIGHVDLDSTIRSLCAFMAGPPYAFQCYNGSLFLSFSLSLSLSLSSWLFQSESSATVPSYSHTVRHFRLFHWNLLQSSVTLLNSFSFIFLFYHYYIHPWLQYHRGDWQSSIQKGNNI